MRSWLFLGLVGWFAAVPVRADTPLRVDQSAERMRVDGALREWKGARFTSLSGAGDTQLRFALATADGGLYVAAEVQDDRLVRGQGAGPKQDALVLTLSMPAQAGAPQVTELWLHAGEAGRSKALAALRSGRGALREDARIRVVEGPRDGAAGYVLEAFVPWSAIPGAEIWEQGRGALRYEDVDASGREPAVVSSADSSAPERLPALALGEGQRDLLGAFLQAQQLSGVKPRFDLRGNVYGGTAPERVAIVDRFVVVVGPEYNNGESYGYLELPLGSGGGIKTAELTDLTGDGRAELVTTLRQRNELGAREVWMIYSLAEASPRVLFGIEVRKEVAGGFIENTLSIERRSGKTPRIVVKPSRTANLAADSYRESAAVDVQPIILPWSGVKARSFGHSERGFALLDEQRAAGAESASAPVPAATNHAPVAELEPITPSVDALLAHFKAQQKLPRALAPRRRQQGNFGFGPAREQLFELDKHLLVVGPEVGDGASYLAYTLPVTAAEEVLYLGHADVTGDGYEELFVRVKQPLTGAEGVHREVVLVLRVDAQGRLGRAFAAEVTRRQGGNVVANRVTTRGGRLLVEPGTSEGWDARAYPFTSEATGGVERLLLPWSDGPRRLVLEGERFVEAP